MFNTEKNMGLLKMDHWPNFQDGNVVIDYPFVPLLFSMIPDYVIRIWIGYTNSI